jgi:arylsulfatase A-like enzyme
MRAMRRPTRPAAARACAGTALALVLALAVAAGCGQPAGKSIVVITLDTTRADHLGCYGYPLPTSPNIDALSQQGVLFEQAYAPMPQTLPSHSTLFTGLPPRAHLALENAHVLRQGIGTLAESLAARDYETAAFIGSRVLAKGTGIERGFAVFDEPTGVQRDIQHEVERSATAVTDSALSWALARHFAAKPFLLWAHYYDPHGPYEPREQRIPAAAVEPLVKQHSEFQALSADALKDTESIWFGYDNELAAMDAQVGRLLKGLRQRKMLEDTVIVVVGDHGEGLMEHGEKSHGTTLFQELMLVPLIVVLPDGSHAGTRIKAVVQMQDLLPTILDLAGLAGAGGELPGVDLATSLRAGAEPAPRPVFIERPYYDPDSPRASRALSHGWGFGEMAGVVDGKDKLIRLPPDPQTQAVVSQLYNLSADPDELHDVAAEHPETVARLSAMLDAWLARWPVDENGEAPVLSPERQEDLERLGYTGGRRAQAPPQDAPPQDEKAKDEAAPNGGAEGGGR